MITEDHAFDYGSFEGVIWRRGKLGFFLRGGGKLKVSYALVRTGDGKDWLLIKHRDRFTEFVLAAEDRHGSILSGLTVDEMKSAPPPEGPLGGIGGEPPGWTSGRRWPWKTRS